MNPSIAKQTTLAGPAEVNGKGLHTGIPANLKLLPAGPDEGVVFVRTDLAGRPRVRATPDNVTATERGTVVKHGEASAATIEHLLGTLYGMGVDNVLVELSGPEAPILDGSAKEYVKAVLAAGIIHLEARRRTWGLAREFELKENGKSVRARASREFTVEFGVDYRHAHLGVQRLGIQVTPENFAALVAPARTFCFEHEIDAMRQAGLAKGGDLDCALVIGEQGLLNPPLRFEDEFVRHKILDFLGDLSLLGRPVQGEFKVEKSGHTFNVKAVREMLVPANGFLQGG